MGYKYVIDKKIPQSILDYFFKEKLDRFIEKDDHNNLKYMYRYSAGFEIEPNLSVEYPPDVIDLVRMHKLVRERRALTILEFGVGFSTLVYADAMKKNKEDFSKMNFMDKKDLVKQNKFEVHSVDSSEKWIENFKKKLKKHPDISPYINLHFTEVEVGMYNNQICHYYKQLPDIIPDFIYLDGPSATDVKGKIQGMSFQQLDRTVMSGDILRFESLLHPGTFILADGRKNNVRFLYNNLKRKWFLKDNSKKIIKGKLWNRNFEDWNPFDYTTLELIEFPTNYWNAKKIMLTNGYDKKKEKGKIPKYYQKLNCY